MITLRPYTQEDSKLTVSWLTDEKAFRLWCADRFDNYPLSPEEFDTIYKDGSPLLGFIAEDEQTAVGHFFMNPQENGVCKFGLIIVDSKKRGQGYGKKMLETAICYAKKHMSAKKVILSVFTDNISAYKCYKDLGFKENGNFVSLEILGEKKDYIELEYLI